MGLGNLGNCFILTKDVVENRSYFLDLSPWWLRYSFFPATAQPFEN
jgi:hypothetical protein